MWQCGWLPFADLNVYSACGVTEEWKSHRNSWGSSVLCAAVIQGEFIRVASFFFIMCTFSCSVGVMSLLLATLSPSAGVAALVHCLLQLIGLMFAGLLVQVETIPAWIGWIRFVSPYFYAFTTAMGNEMQGLLFSLEVSCGV